MEHLEGAEREVANHLLFISRAIDSPGDKQKLSFTVGEEEAVADKLNELIEAFRKALQVAEDSIAELTDPAAVTSRRDALVKSQSQLKAHQISVRKTLESYRQKAKLEGSKQARTSLMQTTVSVTGGRSSASGSSHDVTAALKRTREGLAQEVKRVGEATIVLDNGRATLNSTHHEFDSVKADLSEVKARLKELKWQAQQDRMWIAAGMALLASTVLYIMHQRTGLLFI